MRCLLLLALALTSTPALADEKTVGELVSPTGPLLFTCNLWPQTADPEAKWPPPTSSFILYLTAGDGGSQQLRVFDPDNLLGGETLTHIDEVNRTGDADGEFWVVTVRMPMQLGDQAFAVYPGAKPHKTGWELRGASLGRPGPYTGKCFVFRNEAALEASNKVWPEEASK